MVWPENPSGPPMRGPTPLKGAGEAVDHSTVATAISAWLELTILILLYMYTETE